MAWDDVPEWSDNVAKALLEAVKRKDEDTFFHCCRVGRTARWLGRAAGFNEFEQMVLEYSGLFHDIGKVGIPDSILSKPSKLDTEELEVIKSHPIKSADIIEPLAGTPFFRFLLAGIRHHHERIDGLGYPYGLSGEHIPIMARVISIVDTFDAMTTSRPYRKGLPVEVARKEILDHSGTQFDANLARIFLEAQPYWKDIHNPKAEDEVISLILVRAS